MIWSVTCSANAVTLSRSPAQFQADGPAVWVALGEEHGASFAWLGHWPMTSDFLSFSFSFPFSKKVGLAVRHLVLGCQQFLV